MSGITAVVELPAGQFIFKEGDRGTDMYVIESGSVEIFRGARTGEALAMLGPGDFFGEMAILEDEQRFASAVVSTPCRLRRIDRAHFTQLIAQDSEIAVRIMRKLAARLRRSEKRAAQIRSELEQLKSRSGVAGNGAAVRPSPAALSNSPTKRTAPVRPGEPARPAVTAEPAKPEPARERPKPAAMPAPGPRPSPVAQTVMPPMSPEAFADAARRRVGAPPMFPQVGLLRHVGTGQLFYLGVDRTEFVVGRPDPVTGTAPELNLAALDADLTLSRKHARILREGNELFVREEAHAPTGTFLNGERLKGPAIRVLKPGDRVRFGNVEFEFFAA